MCNWSPQLMDVCVQTLGWAGDTLPVWFHYGMLVLCVAGLALVWED